jgi:hypothetical protein
MYNNKKLFATTCSVPHKRETCPVTKLVLIDTIHTNEIIDPTQLLNFQNGCLYVATFSTFT